MTEFEIIESLAFYFDEYKRESEIKPHWVELIKLFNQSSIGMIDKSIIRYSLPYRVCLNELKKVLRNE